MEKPKFKFGMFLFFKILKNICLFVYREKKILRIIAKVIFSFYILVTLITKHAKAFC